MFESSDKSCPIRLRIGEKLGNPLYENGVKSSTV